jgi:hypothetical protein
MRILLTQLRRVWKSYVGSGNGAHGILQRWFDYLTGSCWRETGRHSKAILVEGRQINLRGLAHHGNKSGAIPFLSVLSESVFMVYLGTISRSRSHMPPNSKFVHAKLYDTVDQLRQDCKLDAPLAPGLNSTWSLLQGWIRGKTAKVCANCGISAARLLELNRPPIRFLAFDSAKPDGMTSLCFNCYQYRQKHHKARPIMFEHRLRSMHAPTPEEREQLYQASQLAKAEQKAEQKARQKVATKLARDELTAARRLARAEQKARQQLQSQSPYATAPYQSPIWTAPYQSPYSAAPYQSPYSTMPHQSFQPPTVHQQAPYPPVPQSGSAYSSPYAQPAPVQSTQHCAVCKVDYTSADHLSSDDHIAKAIFSRFLQIETNTTT